MSELHELKCEKITFGHVCLAKTQVTLYICAHKSVLTVCLGSFDIHMYAGKTDQIEDAQADKSSLGKHMQKYILSGWSLHVFLWTPCLGHLLCLLLTLVLLNKLR